MSDRLILITNDDGLLAPGLDLLARVAAHHGRVVVVAPDRNRSGISSAMSLHGILRLHKAGPDRYACDGTPVDCVLLGSLDLLERRPDWVLSGVNLGFNLGEDVFYSGTVGAAFEGSLQGARAAAFSMATDADPATVERWLGRFLDRWEALNLASGRIWNVNFPTGAPKGFRITTQDRRTYHDLLDRRVDPRGLPYFWIGGTAGPTYARGPGTDAEAALDGWVSLTPLRLDLACPDTLAQRDSLETLLGEDQP